MYTHQDYLTWVTSPDHLTRGWILDRALLHHSGIAILHTVGESGIYIKITHDQIQSGQGQIAIELGFFDQATNYITDAAHEILGVKWYYDPAVAYQILIEAQSYFAIKREILATHDHDPTCMHMCCMSRR